MKCDSKCIITATLITCHHHLYFESGSSFLANRLNAKHCTHSHNVLSLNCLTLCQLCTLDQLQTSNFSGIVVFTIKASQNFTVVALHFSPQQMHVSEH